MHRFLIDPGHLDIRYGNVGNQRLIGLGLALARGSSDLMYHR